jgi:hypothetical protein
VYVGHLLDTACKAVEKIDRTNRAAFDSDETLRLAVAYFDVGYPLGLPGDRLLAAEMRLLTLASAMALLGSAIFLVIAPGTLAVYVPWTFTRWRMAPPLFGFSSLRILGGLMIAAGLPVLLDSFARFAIQGLGTPAPVAPPQRLVVTGLYRYVRNSSP